MKPYFKEVPLYNVYGKVIEKVHIPHYKNPIEMLQWGSRFFFNLNAKNKEEEPYYMEGDMYVTKGNPLPYIK